MSQATRTYRVIFHSQGKVYEIYAKGVHQSGMLGFVEVEKLVFGEKTTLVVDPSEEHLKAEFTGVARTYLPMHAIIRIDEVEKEGHGKITAVAAGEKIMPFLSLLYPTGFRQELRACEGKAHACGKKRTILCRQ